MVLRASRAVQRTSSLLPDAALPARFEICGGVLSIKNGSLAKDALSACWGGLLGESEAVTRKTYSPSGNAPVSQLKYLSLTLSLRSFHADSFTPRISTR